MELILCLVFLGNALVSKQYLLLWSPLQARLSSSSRQQLERACGTGPVTVTSSCKKRSSARTASPRSSSPTPTLDPPASSSRVPGHPNLLYCPCYSTATARFSFNLVIYVRTNELTNERSSSFSSLCS
jgi:hypothetical protein